MIRWKIDKNNPVDAKRLKSYFDIFYRLECLRKERTGLGVLFKDFIYTEEELLKDLELKINNNV